MSKFIDGVMVYKILSKLVTPFEETDAYKLGIIDDEGNNLIPTRKLSSSKEKNAYTYLDRLVFNMKKIINKIGGENKLKNYATALFLIKENYDNANPINIQELEKSFLRVYEEVAVAAPIVTTTIAGTGDSTASTDTPAILGKGMPIARKEKIVPSKSKKKRDEKIKRQENL